MNFVIIYNLIIYWICILVVSNGDKKNIGIVIVFCLVIVYINIKMFI